MIPRSAAEGQEVNSRKADEVFPEHGRTDLPRPSEELALWRWWLRCLAKRAFLPGAPQESALVRISRGPCHPRHVRTRLGSTHPLESALPLLT